MWYLHTEILFGNLKSEVLLLATTPCKNYGRWKKPVIKDHLLYGFCYISRLN